ncbi:molybdopterin-dependent oxidoreductase alpha subunit [Neolewinella xylanilytica]|uniref:Molybdopterin-dependent oxidoreductase alpha subunit n=1 Tax=Neolewinella xylanilytica TaxID=1514080 RepID=A0A2S6I012_9BACT|nr:FdhF/YdeP family oxidoreductase [Neolewinella xylanilytica]PPK84120.1 molybdopterin-dependent oxidoreductase alpha subunit [Neolewinella xylanilytica]
MSNERTPERLTGLQVKKPTTIAAGIPALRYSLKHVNEYMHTGDGLQTLAKLNQKGGFDCPGCAWPDPDGSRTPMAEYCENGVKAIAEEATKRRIGADFFAEHSVDELGTWTDYELGKSGRIAQPLHLRPGAQNYTPITWAEAFQRMSDKLKEIDPDEAVFYTSGRTSNEAAFLYQLFARQLGTNNLPDCSNMCHESTSAALAEVLGLGKGSVTLEDIHAADLIICMGQNPGTNHPRMLSALEKMKENGGRMISVNPLPEPGLMRFVNPQRPLKVVTRGTDLTDLFLQIRINEDQSLLRAWLKILYEREKESPGNYFDQDFVRDHTSGYDKLVAMLEATDLEACIANTGLDRDLVMESAGLIHGSGRIIICYAMGLTQHENSVDTIKELVNLLLAKGSIGKPGAGICPVRGHSNVQGDRTVGIWDKLKPELADALRRHYAFEPPTEDGYDVVKTMEAMEAGKVKFFLGMGGNFVSATPDTERTARGLRNCDMTVHVSTKLNRSHLVHGMEAFILPCYGRTEVDLQAGGEQFVSCENSMGVVQMSKGVLEVDDMNLMSEVAIVCELARRTLPNSTAPWVEYRKDYDTIRDAIAACIPGFEGYNEKVRQPAGFYLPNGPRHRQFATSDEKAQFSATELSPHRLAPGEFLMTTVRAHDQYNTTIYGLHDRYRGVHNERRIVLMHEDDIAAIGAVAEQVVDLKSEYGGTERWARTFQLVPYSIPRGCVAMYFPEANVLVPSEVTARGSNCPISKSVRVRVVF